MVFLLEGWDTLVSKSSGFWDFPGSPVADSMLSVQDAWVQALVGELRSHILHGKKKKSLGFSVLRVYAYFQLEWIECLFAICFFLIQNTCPGYEANNTSL